MLYSLVSFDVYSISTCGLYIYLTSGKGLKRNAHLLLFLALFVMLCSTCTFWASTLVSALDDVRAAHQLGQQFYQWSGCALFLPVYLGAPGSPPVSQAACQNWFQGDIVRCVQETPQSVADGSGLFEPQFIGFKILPLYLETAALVINVSCCIVALPLMNAAKHV